MPAEPSNDWEHIWWAAYWAGVIAADWGRSQEFHRRDPAFLRELVRALPVAVGLYLRRLELQQTFNPSPW